MHIGLMEFLVFLLYYIVAKALIQFLNIEFRRNGLTTAAGVTGLLA
jgi:hypothetical protein